jgi:hypothetical protein
MSDSISGLKAGIKAERSKRQIAELIIRHKENILTAEECDRLCQLIDATGWVPFPCGDAASVKTLAKCGVLWRKVNAYATENNCDGALIQRLVRDELKPRRLLGEECQRKCLSQSANPRHHKAIWAFLKEYEAAYGCED